jgi:hypothetical protein
MHRETKTEFDVLLNAVQEVYDLDILSVRREREYVNARIIFSYILFERGFSKSEIGRYLGKNHATICHYCKNFPAYIKQDAMLKRMYEEAKTVYMNSFDPVYTMERSELKSEVFSLREKVNDLYSQIEESRRERKDANAESTRMEGIMKLVSQRTPMGSEKEVERKLTTWFNGLY